MLEQRGHDVGGSAQVVARLEQRHERQSLGAVLVRRQPMPAGQQQWSEDVLRAVGHADDIGAEQLWAVVVHRSLDDGEEVESFARFGRKVVEG